MKRDTIKIVDNSKSSISLIEKKIVSEGTRSLQCSGFEILYLAIFNHFSCWKVLKLIK